MQVVLTHGLHSFSRVDFVQPGAVHMYIYMPTYTYSQYQAVLVLLQKFHRRKKTKHRRYLLDALSHLQQVAAADQFIA